LGINMVVAGSDPTRPHPPSSRTYLEIPYECARSRPPPARPLPWERIRCEWSLTDSEASFHKPCVVRPRELGSLRDVSAKWWVLGTCVLQSSKTESNAHHQPVSEMQCTLVQPKFQRVLQCRWVLGFTATCSEAAVPPDGSCLLTPVTPRQQPPALQPAAAALPPAFGPRPEASYSPVSHLSLLLCYLTRLPFLPLSCAATPGGRWFCEGRELHDSPDIQIRCAGGDLHTLVIAEAFEDDTGRYTCLATNPSGSDTTSAEVFIEGASSTDSDSESSAFRARPGAMPQAQKKTTSVSLTIGSSSPKTGVTTAVIQPLSVPVQQVRVPWTTARVSLELVLGFQELQNIAASEGQVVVLECRVRGAPPLQVRWFRQGSEIQDSPDFRILQKKEICTLVIAETFPEDAGIFTCSASNDYGSVTSTAQLVVTSANMENCGYDSAGEAGSDHFQHLPPPPPVWETGPFELASKKPAELQQVNSPETGLSTAALQPSSPDREARGVHPGHGVNGLINGKADGSVSPPAPAGLPSPAKEPPPVLARPKL
ncbi:Palladin, partial [Camelus dromedarius]